MLASSGTEACILRIIKHHPRWLTLKEVLMLKPFKLPITLLAGCFALSTSVMADVLYKQDLQGYWSDSGGQDHQAVGNPTVLFDLAVNTSVTINLTSNEDGVLYLLNESGKVISSDNDSGDGHNPRITTDLASGSYQLVAATQLDQRAGEFTLTVNEGNLQFQQLMDIKTISSFNWAYDDSGTGSDDDLTVYHPNLSGASGYYSLGDLAINGRHQPNTSFAVKGSGDVLAKPTDYSLVWKDSGSGGDHDGAFWLPTAPQGYTCLGMMVQANYSKPSTDAMRCVKSEFVLRGAANKTWDDSGSGANWDLGIWTVAAASAKGLSANTFIGNRSQSNNGGDKYWVLNKDRINEVGLGLPADPRELALKYAPKVYMHSDENYFPSSVEWFLQYTHLEGDRYVTDQALGCDSCTDPDFLNGTNVSQSTPPTYAMIVPKGNNVTDIVYWMFYPYNNGKRVCIGWYSPWGCVGGYSTFGNHVGDWEHMTVRLENGQASQVYLSQHSDGEIFNWGDAAIGYEGTHPIVFSADGSHGLYSDARRHVYQNLPNGDFLADDTNYGLNWDTWNNLQVIQWSPVGEYQGDEAWLNFTGRWGNEKSGCGIAETVSGECVLNSGPSGPMSKNASDPNYQGLD